MSLSFSFTHLGCKVNQYEVASIASNFLNAGFILTPYEKGNADIVIINTCCVTSESEAKSRKVLSRARRENKNALIAVTGCFSEINPASAIKSGNPDLIIPNKEKENAFNIICNELIKRGKLSEIPKITAKEFLVSEKTRATLKVQDGCNSFCSYCIIPYARGQLKSKPIDCAVKEAQMLAKNGYKEIVITGIHLTRYGVDLKDGSDLVLLCQKLSEIKEIERIRLGSIEPGYFNEERIIALSKTEKICPHFHLALQSGSKSVLQRMNRKYSPSEYKTEVELLKMYFKNCNITTDIMVGFPGESDIEFNETLSFIKEIGFGKIHVFPFSKRSGTPAFDMDQVKDSVKKERTKIMLNAAQTQQAKFLNSYIGKELNVLLETKKEKNNIGHSENYIHISVESDENLSNTIKKVKITSVLNDMCLGVINEKI